MSELIISAERMAEINQQTIARKNMFYWQTDNGISMQERALLFGSNRENVDEDNLLDQLNKAFLEDQPEAGLHVISLGQRKLFTAQSHVNISCAAGLSDGTSAVARVHPPGLRNGYFSAEAAIIAKARTFGIPVVRSILTRYAQQDELDLTVYEKVEGQDLKLYLQDHPEQEDMMVRKAGIVMAKIHEIPVEGFGFFDNSFARDQGELRGLHKNYRDHCLASLDQNLVDLVDAGYVSETQARKIKTLLETTDKFNIAQARVVHNDMADWNLIAKDGEIAAVIDWDEAHAGDPVADIACWSLFFSEERLGTFLEGYTSHAELGPDFEEKLHLYRLRYLVSKMALRHKIYSYKKNDHVEGLIQAGLAALASESAFFEL